MGGGPLGYNYYIDKRSLRVFYETRKKGQAGSYLFLFGMGFLGWLYLLLTVIHPVFEPSIPAIFISIFLALFFTFMPVSSILTKFQVTDKGILIQPPLKIPALAYEVFIR
jgi:glucan phosphoethanolaminetransferase (alkaline phosphatase superfamily)